MTSQHTQVLQLVLLWLFVYLIYLCLVVRLVVCFILLLLVLHTGNMSDFLFSVHIKFCFAQN